MALTELESGRIYSKNVTFTNESGVGGMTEEEVKLAVGDPDKTVDTTEGRYQWIYTDSKLIVTFGRNGTVVGTTSPGGRGTTRTAARNRSNQNDPNSARRR